MESSKKFFLVNLNITSIILQFLEVEDFLSLTLVNKQSRSLFNNIDVWIIFLKQKTFGFNINLNNFSIKSFDDMKKFLLMMHDYEFQGQNIKLKFRKKSTDLYFSASDCSYDWRGSDHWPVETNKNSLFGEKVIPHLSNVCWFRMHQDFKIPRGKYSFELRIAGDKDFALRKTWFMLSYFNKTVHSNEDLIKIQFPTEVENNYREESGVFKDFKMGEFDLTNCEDEILNIWFHTKEADSWWKYGWWLDCFIFKTLKA